MVSSSRTLYCIRTQRKLRVATFMPMTLVTISGINRLNAVLSTPNSGVSIVLCPQLPRRASTPPKGRPLPFSDSGRKSYSLPPQHRKCKKVSLNYVTVYCVSLE